jgi:cell growth-regulating nucleolar protein
MTEAQKYQGNPAAATSTSLYANKNKPPTKQQQTRQSADSNSKVRHNNEETSTALVTMSTMIQETHQTTALAIVDAPPRAPSPPPFMDTINVFDFLVKDGEDGDWEDEDDMKLDRPSVAAYQTNGFSYGSGPISSALTRFDRSHSKKADSKQTANAFATPAPRRSRAKHATFESGSSTAKKSSKRKFAHVDDLDLSKSGPTDIVMTDATPSNGFVHSGLTGGLGKLLSKAFPPSPDLSGGNSPTSPVKRSRKDKDRDTQRREKKARRKSDSDKEKEDRKSKKHKTDAEHGKSKDKKSNLLGTSKHASSDRRVTRKRSPSPGVTKQYALSLSPPERHAKKPLKAIEYHPSSDAPEVEDLSKALVKVEHAPTTKSVDTFLSCLVKGSETDAGVSVWRALKRWRKQGGSDDKEKELWKELKIRSNERGELVICI